MRSWSGGDYAGCERAGHPPNHVADANAAPTLVAAAAAAAAGDAPRSVGGTDTMGGTAESRASDILAGLGDAANRYSENPVTDALADQIIAYGDLMQETRAIQTEVGDVPLESAPIEGGLDGGRPKDH
jgi:hypothetical protein